MTHPVNQRKPQPFNADMWVEQEFAKVDAANARDRFEDELGMLRFLDANPEADPANESYNAHLGLATRIANRFLGAAA